MAPEYMLNSLQEWGLDINLEPSFVKTIRNKIDPMKAEMPVSTPLPAKVLFKLAILGGILLGGVIGIIQLFVTAIKLIQ